MANKPLNSIDGYSVGPNAEIIVIYGNGDVNAGNVVASGNVNAANANLGNTATANYFIGDGSFLTNLPGGDGIANGFSNIKIPAPNGNIAFSVNSVSNVVVITSNSINIAGNGNFSGNVRVANLQGNLSNGNSNIRIPSPNGNITFSATGNANVVTITGTGLIANGQIRASDPVMELGGYANSAPLDSNDGKDRGVILNYFQTFPVAAFMGWQNANSEFVMASQAAVSDDVVTVYSLGNIRAGYFLGNVLGNIEGNITSPGANTEVLFNDDDQVNASSAFTFNKATNALSVTGNFTAGAVNTLGNINAGNFYTPGNANVLGSVLAGEVFATGNVNAIGNVSGLEFQVNGNLTAVGNINGGNLSTPGQVNAAGTVSGGNLSTAGNLSVSANASILGNANILGNTRFTNAAVFVNRLTVGDPNINPRSDIFSNGYARFQTIALATTGSGNSIAGGDISGRLASFGTANITDLNLTGTLLSTGNISALNINASGTGNFLGNVSVGGNLAVTGNISGNNANFGGLVDAAFLKGDGWQLTNLTISIGNKLENGNSNILVIANSNIVFASNGVANLMVLSPELLVVNTNSNISGNVYVGGDLDVVGNIVANFITANSKVLTNVVQNSNSIIDIDGTNELIKLSVNAASNIFYANANVVAINRPLVVSGDSNISGNLTVTATSNLQGNVNTANLAVTGTANVSGNIIAGNANLGNLVKANFIQGDGYLLTNLIIEAGNAIVNGNSNVVVDANSTVRITSNGVPNVAVFGPTLVQINQPLNVDANINANANLDVNARITTSTLTVENSATFESGLNAANTSTITTYGLAAQTRNGFPGFISASGNVDVGDRLTVSGTANFFGGVNFQSVYANGTLGGNFLSINYTSNTANLNVSNVANIQTLNVNGNIDANSNVNIDGKLDVTGNITAGNANLGNLAKANFFEGDGYLLTNLTITAGSSIVNGTSNVLVITNGNVNTSVAGVPNVQVVTSTGVNVAGYVTATGNITGSNANFSGTLRTGGNANLTANLRVGGDTTIVGNLEAGNANLGNYVYANFFEGDGGLLTNLTISAGNALINGNSNVFVQFSGNINFKANGAANIFVVTQDGARSNGNFFVQNTVNAGAYANGTSNLVIRENSDITLSAGGTANVLKVTNLGATVQGTFQTIGNLSVSGNANVGNLGVGFSLTAGGNINGGNLNTGGNLSVGGVGNIQTLQVPGEATVTGNITTLGKLQGLYVNVTANSFFGNLDANIGNFAGNVYAANFIGPFANGTSNIYIPVANGNINFSANGVPNVFVVTETGANVTNLAITGNLSGSFSINPTGGNITGVNVVQANTFIGTFANGNSNIAIPVANGNVNISAVGNANVLVITGTGVNVAGTSNVTGNIVGGGNLNISGNAVIGGNLTVDGNLIYINVTDLAVEDPIIQLQTGPNAAPPTSNSGKDVGLALNYYDTAARLAWVGWDVSNAEITFGSNVSISSEVVTYNQFANIRAGNAILGNVVTANFFTGNGNGLTNVAATSAQFLANGNSNVTIPAANGNVTISVSGNSNVLVVTGTGANLAGNLNVTGNVAANNFTVGTGSGGNLTGANVIAANTINVATTLNVAGTSNLGANGNVKITGGTSGQYLQTDGTGNLSWATISTSSIANGNSNVSIPSANGNINLSAAGNANIVVVTGTGANVAGTLNITGNVSAGNANLGNLVTANFISGVLTTAAQPNITSVGTLGSLNTTGNVSVGGNLSVTAKSNLGANGNVVITGGSNGQVLSTDGAGNLSWTTISTSSISNGNSNVSISTANGNVTISAAGNANILTVTGTGANISGTLKVTGQSNLGAVGNVVITGGSNGQVLTTDGAGNLSWTTATGGGGGNGNIIIDTFTGNGVQTVFALSATPTSNNFVQVNIDGVTQLHNAFTVSNANVTLTAAPVSGAQIEITVFELTGGGGGGNYTLPVASTTTLGGVKVDGTTITIDGNGVISSTGGGGGGGGNAQFVITNYTGDGSNVAFAIANGSSTNNVLVTLNGVLQTPTTDYSITGNTLTFSVAPSNGQTITFRQLTGGGGGGSGNYVTRTYTGNGVQNTFTVTSGVTANSIFVMENGVVQVPATDYTVSGSNLVFTTAPAANVEIQIREMPSGGGGGGGTPLVIQNEGSNITTAAESINFVGSVVEATAAGNAVTVTVTAASSARAAGYSLVFGG